MSPPTIPCVPIQTSQLFSETQSAQTKISVPSFTFLTEVTVAQDKSVSRLETIGRKLGQRSRSLLKTVNRSAHNRIVAFGILVLLCFLPTWLSVVWQTIPGNSSAFLLNLGFLYLGVDTFWKHRQQLADEPATEDEKVLGYCLIIGGATCFLICFSSVSLKALICMVILLGIAICNWGIAVLQKYPLAIVLIFISVYPNLVYVANTLRETLTGKTLESFMAWMSGMGFLAFGQPVSINGPYLALTSTMDPQKAVEVASGCSGFDMAYPIAGLAFIMGMYFKQTWKKIFALMVIGVVLALAFNVPRIMLLAIAVVYWGKESFDFWHGPIGGQIFSTIMLTLYYYIAMAVIDQKPKQISLK
jgi:exosortase/archaeosortase family protein